MKLTIDFETRSTCDLKKHGAWVYSEDPSTKVLCLALKWGNKPPVLWDMTQNPNHFLDLFRAATTIEAHNMSFEYAIWQNVCVKRMGWPPLPEEKLRCSAAKTAMHSLPRSLDRACAALDLPIQKDSEGYRLMMKMCKPRNPRKGEDPNAILWHESPENFQRLGEYCLQDTNAEEELSHTLSDLPEKELKIWQLDQKINARGIQADLEGARAMIAMVNEHEAILLKKLNRLTNGAVRTAKQVEVMRKHLESLGCNLPDLSAATVMAELKKEDLPNEVREILNIRRSLGRSSSAKYQAIIDRASNDGRVRGSTIYHGAGTGRWSGSGIQPQNLPSRIKIDHPPEEVLGVVKTGGYQLFTALYDDDIMSAAGAVVRSVLMAAEGKELIVADYSAIEGRGLAWLAGEETELEVYRSNKDPYIASASRILHKPYEEVTKEERQSPGKISVLACGYGGSVNAVRKFGGEGLTDDDIKDQIVKPWRQAHPKTVAFWYDLEEACMSAVSEPGKVFSERGVSFRVSNGFLLCRLPSGRLLYYYDPDIRAVKTSWDEMKDSVTYMTVDGMTKQWVRTNTYGGKLAENVTQAICRDLMAEAMLRLEAAGYPIVLTVHDEVISEVPMGFGSVEEFERVMCIVPAWAEGFPIQASGWRGKRYKK